MPMDWSFTFPRGRGYEAVISAPIGQGSSVRQNSLRDGQRNPCLTIAWNFDKSGLLCAAIDHLCSRCADRKEILSYLAKCGNKDTVTNHLGDQRAMW